MKWRDGDNGITSDPPAAVMRIANAPCSWGVLEFDLEGETPAFDVVLSEMARSGYAGTELGDWGFLPTRPAELQHVLSRHGLQMAGAFVPVALSQKEALASGVERALTTARLLAALGQDSVIVLADDNGSDPDRTRHAGRIRPDQGLSDAGFSTLVEAAHRIAGAVVEETGLKTMFHFHCAGFVETPAEIERFAAETDPDLVGLCFDTGHFTFGGGDAVVGLRRYADRIGHLHLKDCDPGVAERARTEGWDYFESVRRGVFCELGRGSVDFPAILEALTEQGYEGWWVVENDVLPGAGSPLEGALRDRAFLAKLGL